MSSNTQTSPRSTESDREHAIRTKNADACPVVQTFDVVGTTWRIQVLYALAESELRFNELKRETEGRSKTLSDALDVLQEHDLVARRMEADAPVAVYYTLTEKGQAFIESLDGLEQWAVEWMDDVRDPETIRPRV
ncbi:MAG: winged helix-turn-helix transcriptional regulator [Halobacteriales archaeon]